MRKGSIEWEYDPEEGLVLHIHPMFRGLVSEETRAHIRASRKEMLLALRNLLDISIQKMEQTEKATGKGRTKIKVE